MKSGDGDPYYGPYEDPFDGLDVEEFLPDHNNPVVDAINDDEDEEDTSHDEEDDEENDSEVKKWCLLILGILVIFLLICAKAYVDMKNYYIRCNKSC